MEYTMKSYCKQRNAKIQVYVMEHISLIIYIVTTITTDYIAMYLLIEMTLSNSYIIVTILHYDYTITYTVYES